MKYELKDVELTGEYRKPITGELYIDHLGAICLAEKNMVLHHAIVRSKATPETESRPEPKFKSGEWVQYKDGTRVEIVERMHGTYRVRNHTAYCFWVCEEDISPLGESKPSPKMVGEWRFRPTGENRQIKIGDWVRAKDNGIILQACEGGDCSGYELLELVEQPREEFEFPMEVVLERCKPDETSWTINDQGIAGGGGLSANYRVKDGQFPQ